LLVRRIRELLYEQRFTISGARNRLDSNDRGVPVAPDAETPVPLDVNELRAEIEAIRALLSRSST
jgi:hypothetical protein